MRNVRRGVLLFLHSSLRLPRYRFPESKYQVNSRDDDDDCLTSISLD